MGPQVAAASVVGRRHRSLFRNNQDAAAVRRAEGAFALAVCDGCGSSRGSEWGAQWGAAWLVTKGPRLLHACSGDANTLASTLASALIDDLAALVSCFAEGPRETEALVAEALLFTVLAAYVGPERTWVLASGDGLWAMNGALTELSRGEGNAPPYIGYALLDAPAQPSTQPHRSLPSTLQVLLDVPTEDVDTLILATDGASAVAGELMGELGSAPLYAHPSPARASAALLRRLRALSTSDPRVDDDISVALYRRGGGPLSRQ